MSNHHCPTNRHCHECFIIKIKVKIVTFLIFAIVGLAFVSAVMSK